MINIRSEDDMVTLSSCLLNADNITIARSYKNLDLWEHCTFVSELCSGEVLDVYWASSHKPKTVLTKQDVIDRVNLTLLQFTEDFLDKPNGEY